jgi:RNA polymerase sigma-70 factor (family 1)
LDNYSTYSDKQLIALLKLSDEAAFKTLYNRYWKRLFAMAFLRLQHHAEAEDIVQDVFTTLWAHRETDIHSPENWLATVTKHKIINLISRNLQKRLNISELPDEGFKDPLLDSRLLEQQVAAEVDRLPEKCKLVFQFSRQEGYSNRQIAHEMNISEKMVEKHLNTARKKLSFQLRHLLHSILFL